VPQTSDSVNAFDGMSFSLAHTGEGCVFEQRCGMNICVGCVIVHGMILHARGRATCLRLIMNLNRAECVD